MDNETLTPEQSQALWDEVAAEKSGAAVKPPVESAKPESTKPSTEEPKPVSEEKPDPLVELRQMVEKIDHRTKSTEGRIGAIDIAYKSLQEKLDAASKAASQVTDAPTQAQMQAAIHSPERWNKLKSEFPEWGSATEEYVGAHIDAKLAALKMPQALDQTEIDRIVEERVAKQSEMIRQESINAHLDSVVDGDWVSVINSSSFKDWMSKQPAEIQALAGSDHLRDAAKILRLYEKSKDTGPAADVTATRRQVLDAATSLPRGTKTPAPKSIDDMSPQELWNYEAKLRAQRKGKNY